MDTLTVEDWAEQVISVMTPAEIGMIRRVGHARHWAPFVGRLSWDEGALGPRPATKIVLAEIELQVIGAMSARPLKSVA